MNRYKRNSSALVSALGLLLAATMTAAIALTAASEYPGRRVLSIDPKAQRSDVPKDGDASSTTPAAPNDDPELMRTDRANVHHG